MIRGSFLGAALALVVTVSTQGGLIPNGDFETGDFTDWQTQLGGTVSNGGVAKVEFLDGSYRAVLDLNVVAGSGVSSAELLSASLPPTWGNGQFLQFDASYSFATNGVGATLLFSAITASANEALVNLTQQDASPLSGSTTTVTYTLPWSLGAIDIFTSISAPEAGSASMTVVLDNFRLIPEPSTWVLAATALLGIPFFAVRRRRR
jgi:hypothetical protein